MQDLEERFTLFVALAFVVAEDLLSTGQLLVDGSMVWECVKIFLCEILVDILKHVTLAKFNNVRPGTYREFFRYAFRSWPCCCSMLAKKQQIYQPRITPTPKEMDLSAHRSVVAFMLTVRCFAGLW